MENPYQSPEAPFAPGSQPAVMPPYQRPGRLVHHVRIIAILMMVQGGLEVLAGIGLIGLGVFMPQFMAMQMETMPQRQQQMQLPPELFWIMFAMYGGMGLVALVAGILHGMAGMRNYRFQGRRLGIVAASAGLLTLFTCYCLPTAIGVAVYGLIVLLNREVAEAFAMVEAGHSPDDVLAHFN